MQQPSESELILLRKEKLLHQRQLHAPSHGYPNDFQRDQYAADLQKQYASTLQDELLQSNIPVAVAGRLVRKRAPFARIQDQSGSIQLYVTRAEQAQSMDIWDTGDILGIRGHLRKSNRGDLYILVETQQVLNKSLRPLPTQLLDPEICHRQRHLDLIVNPEHQQRFIQRIQIIQSIRSYLIQRRFLEVETPMLHTLPGGAAACPFSTTHNALNIEMFLRISPELYLKRLVVAGFERVFEIGRNFRNEGVSTKHNPEFTLLEFYQAYTDYTALMALTEDLFRTLARDILGKESICYQGHEYDLKQPFHRMTLRDSLLHTHPNLTEAQVDQPDQLVAFCQSLDIECPTGCGIGKLQLHLFEKTVEPTLLEPTFITEYPLEVSPLARKKDNHPHLTDRFECFIHGMEIANGFSELNDPEDQRARFQQQVQARANGDQEAMPYDADYIASLEYGLPPTAGEGIGIDRLVMLLTNTTSIRDVILFPHMKPLNTTQERQDA